MLLCTTHATKILQMKSVMYIPSKSERNGTEELLYNNPFYFLFGCAVNDEEINAFGCIRKVKLL